MRDENQFLYWITWENGEERKKEGFNFVFIVMYTILWLQLYIRFKVNDVLIQLFSFRLIVFCKQFNYHF